MVCNKVLLMLKCIEEHTEPLCSVDEILPYLSVCNRIFEKPDVAVFPRDSITDIGERLVVPGLWQKIQAAYDQGTRTL